MRGKFITFEGIDGAGKSSHVEWFAGFLRQKGLVTHVTREPGGTELGEKLRELLLHSSMHLETETLLMFAARREHLAKVIEPALARGTHVVCDRFADSTIAYQSYAGGLDRRLIEDLHRATMTGADPDLTIVLDIATDQGLNRAASRHDDETRFERKGREFHERLRQGFLDIAKRAPKRCIVIDAAQSIEQVQSAVQSAIKSRLSLG